MNRRKFFATGAASVAGLTFFPEDLFAKDTILNNQANFPKRLPFKRDGEWKEFEIYVDIAIHEPVPGMKYHTLAFNGTIPGPEIRVQAGDKVRVRFKNKTELNHTIHWHGLYVPWRMAGVYTSRKSK